MSFPVIPPVLSSTPQNGNGAGRDPIATAFLMIVLFVACFALYQSRPSAPPAPAPFDISPYVPPVQPSPCGPNRCPYRQTAPFTLACPWCRNYVVAVPPIDAGQRGSFSKYVPSSTGDTPKK